MDGRSSAAGFQSHDIMFNSLTNAQHHTIIPIDAKTPKAELGSSSNFATINTGVNAAFKPRDTFVLSYNLCFECLTRTIIPSGGKHAFMCKATGDRLRIPYYM